MEATTGNRDMAKEANLKHTEEEEEQEEEAEQKEEGKSVQQLQTHSAIEETISCLSFSKLTILHKLYDLLMSQRFKLSSMIAEAHGQLILLLQILIPCSSTNTTQSQTVHG